MDLAISIIYNDLVDSLCTKTYVEELNEKYETRLKNAKKECKSIENEQDDVQDEIDEICKDEHYVDDPVKKARYEELYKRDAELSDLFKKNSAVWSSCSCYISAIKMYIENCLTFGDVVYETQKEKLSKENEEIYNLLIQEKLDKQTVELRINKERDSITQTDTKLQSYQKKINEMKVALSNLKEGSSEYAAQKSEIELYENYIKKFNLDNDVSKERINIYTDYLNGVLTQNGKTFDTYEGAEKEFEKTKNSSDGLGNNVSYGGYTKPYEEYVGDFSPIVDSSGALLDTSRANTDSVLDMLIKTMTTESISLLDTSGNVITVEEDQKWVISSGVITVDSELGQASDAESETDSQNLTENDMTTVAEIKAQVLTDNMTRIQRIMNSDTVKTVKDKNTGNVTIEAEQKEFQRDSAGIIKKVYYTCPECGIQYKSLKKDGLCADCHKEKRNKEKLEKKARRAQRRQRRQQKLQKFDKKVNKILKYIENTIMYLDLTLEMVMEIPDLLKMVTKIPPSAKEFLTNAIDIVFLKLSWLIDQIMILRDEGILTLLKQIKYGKIDNFLEKIVPSIRLALDTVSNVKRKVLKKIDEITKLLKDNLSGIDPQSYAFVITPKSAQMPLYGPKKLVIPVHSKMTMGEKMRTMMNVLDTKKIDSWIEKALPPLTEPEYFLPPEAFRVRYALSKENGGAVSALAELLAKTLKLQPEVFPKWKDLQIYNPWFVAAIMTGWGPVTKDIFGDYIFHAII